MTRHDPGDYVDPAHAQEKRPFKSILGLVLRLEGYPYFHYLVYATQAGGPRFDFKLDTGISYGRSVATNPMVGLVDTLNAYTLTKILLIHMVVATCALWLKLADNHEH